MYFKSFHHLFLYFFLWCFSYSQRLFCFLGTTSSGEGVQQSVSLGDRPATGGGDLASSYFDQIRYIWKKQHDIALFSGPVERRWQVVSTLSIMAQEVSGSGGRDRSRDDGGLHGNATCWLPHALHVHATLYELGTQETAPAWRFVTTLTGLLHPMYFSASFWFPWLTNCMLAVFLSVLLSHKPTMPLPFKLLPQRPQDSTPRLCGPIHANHTLHTNRSGSANR